MKNKNRTLLIIFLILVIIAVVLYYYFQEERVYISKEYNSSGNLIGTNEYVIRDGNVILHGKYINYNDKGIKTSEGQFVNDEPNGRCSYYYDNGKLERVDYKKDSKVSLEGIYYNRKGFVNKYIMCDTLGKTRFIIKFEDNQVTMYDGYSIFPLGQYKLINKMQSEIKKGEFLNVGDTLKYNYLLANIPNTERTFKIEIDGIDNLKAKRTITKKLPTEIIVEEVLTKKGLNRVRAISQYTFKDKITPTYKDTVSFDVYVK